MTIKKNEYEVRESVGGVVEVGQGSLSNIDIDMELKSSMGEPLGEVMLVNVLKASKMINKTISADKYRYKELIDSEASGELVELVIKYLILGKDKNIPMMQLQWVVTECAREVCGLYNVRYEDIKYVYGLVWRCVYFLNKFEFIYINSWAWDDREYEIIGLDNDYNVRYKLVEKYIRLPKPVRGNVGYNVGYSAGHNVRYDERFTRTGESRTTWNRGFVKILESVEFSISAMYLRKAIDVNKKISMGLSLEYGEDKKVGYYIDMLMPMAEERLAVNFSLMQDNRGRYYYREIGSIHSPSHEKSFLRFHDKVLLNQRGKYWLDYVISNESVNHKLDKSDDRFVNGKRLQDMSEHGKIKKMNKLRDSGSLVLSDYGSMLNRVNVDKPTDIMIGLDMRSSGPAIMSILTKCLVGCDNVGLSGNRVTSIPMELQKIMGGNIDSAKTASMTSFYGSEAKPREVYGNKRYREFLAARESIAPGAVKYLDLMKTIWNNMVNKKMLNTDGSVEFSVCGRDVEYFTYVRLEDRIIVRFPDGGFVSTTHFMNVNAMNEDSMAFGVNILHSIDRLLLEQIVIILRDMGVKNICVNHDSVYVNPNNMDKLKEASAIAIRWLYNQDILEDIVEQYIDKNVLEDNYVFDYGELELSDLKCKNTFV